MGLGRLGHTSRDRVPVTAASQAIGDADQDPTDVQVEGDRPGDNHGNQGAGGEVAKARQAHHQYDQRSAQAHEAEKLETACNGEGGVAEVPHEPGYRQVHDDHDGGKDPQRQHGDFRGPGGPVPGALGVSNPGRQDQAGGCGCSGPRR